MRAAVSALALIVVGGAIYFVLGFASWLLTQFVNATAWWLGPLLFVALGAVMIYAIGKAFDKGNN